MRYILIFLILSFDTHAQDYLTEITVDKNGNGDFSNIQDAINASKSFPSKKIIIYIKDGVYKEKLTIYSWNTSISLLGESRDGTIITYDDSYNKINKGRNSTFHTYTMKVNGNNFNAKNMTIINSSGPQGKQAVALHVEADRATFINVTVKGFQDTVYLAGEGHRSYFKNCHIEGSIDFIFGEGTALFEKCEIKSLLNGFITAASTSKSNYGFIFSDCRLTSTSNVSQVYLGRPWREHAHTVFINSYFGPHIHLNGWHNWGKINNESTVFYAEHNNTGPGSSLLERTPWSYNLSVKEAESYTIETIFRGWKPTPLDSD